LTRLKIFIKAAHRPIGTGIACVSVAVKNAFNTVSRSHVIKEVFARPEISMLRGIVKAFYGAPTPLLTKNAAGIYSAENIIESGNGVRQGDPLGSALFTLAMHPFYKSLQSKEIPLADQDDNTMSGTSGPTKRQTLKEALNNTKNKNNYFRRMLNTVATIDESIATFAHSVLKRAKINIKSRLIN